MPLLSDTDFRRHQATFHKNGFASDTASLLEVRRDLYKPSELQARVERRSSSRWHQLLPAVVRGVNPEGGRFETKTMIENFSSSGLFLHIDQAVKIGEPLFVMFRLTPDQKHDVRAPRVAVRGTIARLVPAHHPHMQVYQAVAVRINRFKFLSEPNDDLARQWRNRRTHLTMNE